MRRSVVQGILHSLAYWGKNVAYHLDIHKQPDVNVIEPQHPLLHLLMFLQNFIWSTTSLPQITIPTLIRCSSFIANSELQATLFLLNKVDSRKEQIFKWQISTGRGPHAEHLWFKGWTRGTAFKSMSLNWMYTTTKGCWVYLLSFKHF